VIAVDSSALLAMVFKEPQVDACKAALAAEDDVLISAGTVAELLIVAAGRGVAAPVARIIDELELTVVPVTLASARRIAAAYQRRGKGFHPAGLNFGDCFAYELAKQRGCRLLYVGDDFAKTDIDSAL
jgi:ribonuclease VapC